MNTMLEKAKETARELHRKNQNVISTARVDAETLALFQQISRTSVIDILVFAGVEKQEAVRITDNEIVSIIKQ